VIQRNMTIPKFKNYLDKMSIMSSYTDYKVIRASTNRDLEAEMKRALEEGWEPQGGVCYSYTPEFGGRYIQAVVKRRYLD
jgi:hypothetical protein